MGYPIRVAVIGAGALGEHHARIYSQLEETNLVGVVDVRKEKARRVASRFGCEAYEKYQDLLGSVDAVSLVVPTRLHASIGIDFLRRGVHVLVEKPIAADADQAKKLISSKKTTGVVLHVGHLERFNPALLAIKPLITQPRFFEAHRLGVFVSRSLDVDVVLDLMIHDLDLILHLVPSPIEEVRAVGIPVLTSRVDIANARLEFKNGCVANITASRVSQEKIRKLRFFQTTDYVSLDLHKQEVEMHSLVDTAQGKQMSKRDVEVFSGEPLKLEIQAFVGDIRKKSESCQSLSSCSAEEGQRALSLALQIKTTIEKKSKKISV